MELAGPRIVAGMGAGAFDHEFAAVGAPSTVNVRTDLVRVNAVVRRRRSPPTAPPRSTA